MSRVAAQWDEWATEDDFGDPLGPFMSSGIPSTLTYPTTLYVQRVQIALGADLSADPSTWAWLDITSRVRQAGIVLSTGRRDESSTVTPGSAEIRLDNRDGALSRRNPSSPYFGLLSKNTPIWATVDAGSGEKTRLEMFVNEWPTRWWDTLSTDSTVTIQCAGILRRLAQGEVLKHAMRRAILGAAPIGYWPLEDEFDSTQAASGLSGGAPLVVTGGTVTFGDVAFPAGGLAGPDLSASGRLSAPVPVSTTTVYTIEYMAKCALDLDGIPLGFAMSGSSYQYFFAFTQFLSGSFPSNFRGGDAFTQTSYGSFPVVANYDNEWHHFRVILKQDGSDVTSRVWADGVEGTPGGPTAATLGRIAGAEVNLNLVNTTITGSVAEVAIYDYEMTEDHSPALDAFAGEQAHVRIARLCREEGVIYESVTSTSSTVGPQDTDSLLGLLRAAEAVDGGTLYEKRWGLAYKSLAEYYNQPVSLALDFNQGHIADLPEPADDDQRTRNRWTVSRIDGSEATAEETTGPMGTGVQGPGLYDDSVTLNLETDGQLANQAAWRVHLGTVDEDRWPVIGLNFLAKPELIGAWTALGFGARITVANPPAQMPPDQLDLIVEGHTEWWDGIGWRATLNCSPASAYRVHVVASTDANLGRVDAASSTLAADATSGATTISVASPGALWRTGAVNFDIAVGGERMTVTNISGASSPQTFTVTRSVNGVVKAQTAIAGPFATKVSLWKPGIYAL